MPGRRATGEGGRQVREGWRGTVYLWQRTIDGVGCDPCEKIVPEAD